jgi:hypothetical protein
MAAQLWVRGHSPAARRHFSFNPLLRWPGAEVDPARFLDKSSERIVGEISSAGVQKRKFWRKGPFEALDLFFTTSILEPSNTRHHGWKLISCSHICR